MFPLPAPDMSLDPAPLANAIDRLRAGLARYRQSPDDGQLRDGLIQRFEFTYELSHRTLKRYLRQTAASPDALDRMSFADLIRTAGEQRLLQADWAAWRRFRDMRARTSHTYDQQAALAVVAEIPAFLAEVAYLCAELQRRLA
jgi:nucleotidyltransferase substrate binding protein (TIGR01987 family)